MSYSEEYYRRRINAEDLYNRIKENEFQQWKKEKANKKPGIMDWIVANNIRYYTSFVLSAVLGSCIIYAIIKYFSTLQ